MFRAHAATGRTRQRGKWAGTRTGRTLRGRDSTCHQTQTRPGSATALTQDLAVHWTIRNAGQSAVIPTARTPVPSRRQAPPGTARRGPHRARPQAARRCSSGIRHRKPGPVPDPGPAPPTAASVVRVSPASRTRAIHLGWVAPSWLGPVGSSGSVAGSPARPRSTPRTSQRAMRPAAALRWLVRSASGPSPASRAMREPKRSQASSSCCPSVREGPAKRASRVRNRPGGVSRQPSEP